MKYQRRVNQKLAGDLPRREAGPAVAGPCWPEDESLPKIVQRNGETVLDEGWVRIDDDDDPAPDAGV